MKGMNGMNSMNTREHEGRWCVRASAGTGPIEVCRFVRALGPALAELARERGLAVESELATIDRSGSGARSIELLVVGPALHGLADLLGTHELIDESRRERAGRHRGARKRWFAAVEVERAIEIGATIELDPDQLEWSFARSSGPGGQHVNTTASAVRLLHRPSGLSVRVGEGRSQHHNRTLALRRLAERLAERERLGAAEREAERRLAHYRVIRGQAVARWRWSVRDDQRLERLDRVKEHDHA
ncbi:peptide chain release factor-like protein [Nannocystaceae bacterium ST9]